MNDPSTRSGQADANGQHRLTPEMASFRLLVLTFVREYLEANGGSPSYGEIAAGLGSDRDRVRKSVKRLVKQGELVRTPGPRGLRLPSVRDVAVRQLREMGFIVDEDIGRISHPDAKRPLLPPPSLRYPEYGSDEELDGDGKQAA